MESDVARGGTSSLACREGACASERPLVELSLFQWEARLHKVISVESLHRERGGAGESNCNSVEKVDMLVILGTKRSRCYNAGNAMKEMQTFLLKPQTVPSPCSRTTRPCPSTPCESPFPQ
jgi:hypothetical protein